MSGDPGQAGWDLGTGKHEQAQPLLPPALTLSYPLTGYEALAEASCPTALPQQPSEHVVSSGPEDCGFFPNGAFDHCLGHIPSIYTDT